jgi:hypothetical protein
MLDYTQLRDIQKRLQRSSWPLYLSIAAGASAGMVLDDDSSWIVGLTCGVFGGLLTLWRDTKCGRL